MAMDLHEIIKSARGDREVDLRFVNGKIFNVFTDEIVSTDFGVDQGVILGFGDYRARQTVDLGGRFVCPGFIDSHVHMESAMVSPAGFARAVLPRGTTAVVADPHEIANVLGTAGIRYMLNASAGLPVTVCFTLPSCVPASPLETSGANLAAEDLAPFMGMDRVVGLAEMMNYPGVVSGCPEVLEKIIRATKAGLALDGHGPGLSGKGLNAYASAGIGSDHECIGREEALEKLRLGMFIMIREGTCARNLADLLPLVNERTSRRMMWCTDDRHPHDLLDDGHIDAIVREAVRAGLDPAIAIRMATLNPAEYFGLKDAGAIAPGRRADLVVFSDPGNIRAEDVYVRGRLASRNGELLPVSFPPVSYPLPGSMNLESGQIDLSIAARGKRLQAIEIVPGQIVTRRKWMDAAIRDGFAVSDPSRDLIKIAVVERHTGSGNTGKGFVTGLGLRRGAIASSVAHDSHNLIVAGVGDKDMKVALAAVADMGGGLAAVGDGRVLAALPLPLAGLMSDEPLETVRRRLDDLLAAARNLGSGLPDPFMTLSFLALPVIPELKITDRGLVDVARFDFVDLFGDNHSCR